MKAFSFVFLLAFVAHHSLGQSLQDTLLSASSSHSFSSTSNTWNTQDSIRFFYDAQGRVLISQDFRPNPNLANQLYQQQEKKYEYSPDSIEILTLFRSNT